MKLKFFIVSVALCLFNLNAADAATSSSAADVPPALVFNPEELAKPTGMSSMQWIDALERDRNTADCIGNFAAFKALTKEISATIGGKYGFAIPTTQDEIITLSYSIIRTRHKFCGKLNMLSDFYGINSTYENTAHAAFILAVDTMATKAMDDEDFENLWAAFNSESAAAAGFIAMVREHASANEKAPLTAALQEPLNAFFLTNHGTVSLANEVFNIFAPKITLRKIYMDMVGGTYRGWTVHGVDAFAKLIILKESECLSDEHRDRNRELESIFRNKLNECLKSDKGLMDFPSSTASAQCPSSDMISKLAISSQTVTLEYANGDGIYVKDHCRYVESGAKHLFLTREVDHKLINFLRKHSYKVPEKELLDIYRNYYQFLNKFSSGEHVFEEVSFLVNHGISETMGVYAAFLSNGQNNFPLDIVKAIEVCKDAIDLGDQRSKERLSIFLTNYAVQLYKGEGSIAMNRLRSVEICKEAISTGSEVARRNLPIFLYNFAKDLFYGDNGVRRNTSKAFETFKEAVALGDKGAIRDLPIFLKDYAIWLHKGVHGIVKNIPKAVDVCREAISLGNQEAKILLPTLLNNYAVLLFQGESGTSRDIIKAIEVCRDASALGSESATRSLPIFLKDYALWLYKGENGVVKDIPLAINISRESVTLGNQEAKGFFPTLLNNYAAWLFRGENGIEQNLAMAVKVCREAAALGHEKTRQKLPVYLNTYASALFEGRDNVQQDISHAIEVCREAAELGNEEAIAKLPTMLAAIH